MIPIVLWALLFFGSQVSAASFDCAKASATAEQLICGSDPLSKADEDMGAAYRRRVTRNPAVRDAQKLWIKARDEHCGVAVRDLAPSARTRATECLYQAIKARAAALDESELASLKTDLPPFPVSSRRQGQDPPPQRLAEDVAPDLNRSICATDWSNEYRGCYVAFSAGSDNQIGRVYVDGGEMAVHHCFRNGDCTGHDIIPASRTKVSLSQTTEGSTVTPLLVFECQPKEQCILRHNRSFRSVDYSIACRDSSMRERLKKIEQCLYRGRR